MRPNGEVVNSTEQARAFVTIEASWDRADSEAVERITFEGDIDGRFNGLFRCGTNPFEAANSCVVEGVDSDDAVWPELIDSVLRRSLPITAGKIDRAEAEQIATVGSGSPPPPPPPPAPGSSNTENVIVLGQGLRLGTNESGQPTFQFDPDLLIAPPAGQPDTTIASIPLFGNAVRTRILEAELLVDPAFGQGVASSQDMTGFGPQWSNNGQLFWRPNAVGSLLNIPLAVGQGAYRANIHLTSAPDYGLVRAYIHYETAPGVFADTSFVDFDGYAPTVAAPRTVTLDVGPSTGQMTLVLVIIGQNAAASGILAGVDRIDLTLQP